MAAKKSLERNLRRDLDSVVHGSREELSAVADRYLRSLVDPRGSKPVRCPFPGAGVARRSSLVVAKATGQSFTGANGLGAISFNPNSAGPYNDRPVVTHTSGSTNTLMTSSVMPTAAGTGVSNEPFSNGGLLTAATTTPEDLEFRVVSAGLYITPDSQALQQGGMIHLLESPAHEPLQNLTLSQIKGHPRTRAVSGKTPGGRTEIVLNWHPQGRQTAANLVQDDFAWTNWSVGASSLVAGVTLAAVLSAAQGTGYNWEAYVIFETRGRFSGEGKSPIVDSRGCDLVFNALATKMESGWVGTPSEAQHSYLTSIWHQAKRLGYKVFEELKNDNDIKALAKSVAGFAL